MSRAAPVTVAHAREKLNRKYTTWCARWALGVGLPDSEESEGSAEPLVSLPLHPPSERSVLDDVDAAVTWVRSWQSDRTLGPWVSWSTRRWPSLGEQQVPERLVFHQPADLAQATRNQTHWTSLTHRFATLLNALPGLPGPSGKPPAEDHDLRAVLPGLHRELVALTETDFHRLTDVVTWLVQHPHPGLFARQLPIRGVDSKWVEAHRRLVRTLHQGCTGSAELGLRQSPGLIRVRFLDAALAPGGLDDVAAPVESWAGLALAPTAVIVVENLVSALAMPPMPGTVVVHGNGYAVDTLHQIPWVTARPVIYWGDLDSHGLAILNSFRARGVRVQPVMMDLDTLHRFIDLAVTEPTPHTADTFQYLTTEELAVLQYLRESENLRLEQERIDWDYAVGLLRHRVQTLGA